MGLDRKQTAFWEEHLGQLIGWKITKVALDDSADALELDPEGIYGLVLQKGPSHKVAWVMCDPEGNGGGFLDIVDG